MERPIFQPMGTPVEELDTPALVVDLDIMDRNIQTFQGYFGDAAAKVRHVVTSHLCPRSPGGNWTPAAPWAESR